MDWTHAVVAVVSGTLCTLLMAAFCVSGRESERERQRRLFEQGRKEHEERFGASEIYTGWSRN